MSRVNHVFQLVAFSWDIGDRIVKKLRYFIAHDVHGFAENTRDFKRSTILAVWFRKEDFLEFMVHFPLIICVVGLMLRVAFIVQSNWIVSEVVEAMEVLGVVILSSQIELFHYRAADAFYHPVVRTEYRLIVFKSVVNLWNVWTSIVTAIILDIIVVEYWDGYCVETVRHSIRSKILIDPIKVSDTEGRSRNAITANSFDLCSGHWRRPAWRIQPHEFRVSALHRAVHISALDENFARVILIR